MIVPSNLRKCRLHNICPKWRDHRIIRCLWWIKSGNQRKKDKKNIARGTNTANKNSTELRHRHPTLPHSWICKKWVIISRRQEDSIDGTKLRAQEAVWIQWVAETMDISGVRWTALTIVVFWSNRDHLEITKWDGNFSSKLICQKIEIKKSVFSPSFKKHRIRRCWVTTTTVSSKTFRNFFKRRRWGLKLIKMIWWSWTWITRSSSTYPPLRPPKMLILILCLIWSKMSIWMKSSNIIKWQCLHSSSSISNSRTNSMLVKHQGNIITQPTNKCW